MEIIKLKPEISLIDILPPVAGFRAGLLGTYVVKSEKIALIDVGPASSQGELLSGLSGLHILPEDVDYILCTHIHLDHSGGLGQAMQRMQKAVAIVHEKGIDHLVNPARLWESSLRSLQNIALDYGKPEPMPRDRLVAAREGMVIELGDLKLEAVLTPGHATHHTCFFERKTGRLFAGDAAGIRPAETDKLQPASPPPFDLKLALESLDKLIALNPAEVYYAHFGYSLNAVARLREYRQLLLSWSGIISGHLEDNPDLELISREILALNEDKKTGPQPDTASARNAEFFVSNDILGIWQYLKKGKEK